MSNSGRMTAVEARGMLDIRKEGFEHTKSLIRHMCDVAIKDASSVGKKEITFTVPVAMWGRETYDHKDMGRALAEQLYSDGFDVTGTTTRFTVSWDVKIRETTSAGKKTHQQRHPTGGAMIPPFNIPAVARGTISKRGKVERVVNINV